MVESYVLRGTKLASMALQTFLATYGQIARLLPYVHTKAEEGARQVWDLHRRHGQEIVSVLNAEFAQNNLEGVQPNSLRAMFKPSSAAESIVVDASETEPSASEQAGTDHHDYRWEAICFAIDAVRRKIVFANGIEVSGKSYALIATLAEQFSSDREKGLLPENHSFIGSERLSAKLQIEPPTLRKALSRTRASIRQKYLVATGRRIEDNDIIETREWKGYRLNPYLVPVNVSQLQSKPARMSQVSPSNVTSSRTEH